jgi:hypothetical protein
MTPLNLRMSRIQPAQLEVVVHVYHAEPMPVVPAALSRRCTEMAVPLTRSPSATLSLLAAALKLRGPTLILVPCTLLQVPSLQTRQMVF